MQLNQLKKEDNDFIWKQKRNPLEVEARARGIPFSDDLLRGQLGRNLPGFVLDWVFDQMTERTNRDVRTIIRDHVGERIKHAMDLQRGKSRTEFFHLFPVHSDAKDTGTWAGADDQWTKLLWNKKTSLGTGILDPG